MDFGVQVGLDGLVGSDTSYNGLASITSSDPGAKQNSSSRCSASPVPNQLLQWRKAPQMLYCHTFTSHLLHIIEIQVTTLGIFNAVSMHGVLTETGWPFTQSQWMELEHQALIYKYITANVPIPSNLLIPIRNALDSAGFLSFSGGHFKPSALKWGTFHMGFSSNTDPEPGRCRRTDGKKWRCSRDAVAEQ
ncbi:hypothetical protein OIU77_025305 [Salix suchowensis]|uniref:Growth-regulating factor n=1 Tax=Salix suchowensis TaxID=1278906 RepID=A0ABQ9BZ71_9ROSI|nr:hypothetical protein OIU77_025305 [Salix suchowensis]